MLVGVDIVEVSRINQSIKKYDNIFLCKVFSPQEISYCKGKVFPSRHFAGKFAAKEAVRKILLQKFPEIIYPFYNIQILNTPEGAPYVQLNRENTSLDISVSISHTENYAVAVAILENA
jgi:holo-[acyl-carrier protein] synthase